MFNRVMFRILCLILILFLGTVQYQAATRNINVEADKFELDVEDQYVRARGNVVVTHEDIILTGDVAKFDKERQTVRINGNVVIKKDSMTLKCDRAVALNNENRVDGFGDVEFSYDEMKGSSDRASYFLDRKLVILASSANITRLKDSLSGDRVFIDIARNYFKTVGNSELILSVSELETL